jgi:transposase-like protein
MNPQTQLCPACRAKGKEGQIGIHSRKEQRYRCKVCQRTFKASNGTAIYRLKKPELFCVVMTLMAYGCPAQAVVMAFGLSENTVHAWLKRGGQHCQQVHEQTVGQQQWDLQHLQADELKVQTQSGVVWLALVMMVSTRLWLGAALDTTRSKAMVIACLAQAARCALCRPLLLAVDGFNMYANAVKKTFRSRHPVGKGGRLKWVVWKQIVITQVVKQRGNVRGHIEQVVLQGEADIAQQLRMLSKGGTKINTAYIERLNATFRQRLACLARRSRAQVRQTQTLTTATFLMGCVYNFCTPHQSLALPLYLPHHRRRWVQRTPAMAAGLTDHRWTVAELLCYHLSGRAGSPRYSA